MTSKRMIQALASLNDFIDGDRQMLCDRIKKLERSHKRMYLQIKASYWLLNKIYNRVELPDDLMFYWRDLMNDLRSEVHRKVL